MRGKLILVNSQNPQQWAPHLASCRQGDSAIMMEQSFAVMATRYCWTCRGRKGQLQETTPLPHVPFFPAKSSQAQNLEVGYEVISPKGSPQANPALWLLTESSMWTLIQNSGTWDLTSARQPQSALEEKAVSCLSAHCAALSEHHSTPQDGSAQMSKALFRATESTSGYMTCQDVMQPPRMHCRQRSHWAGVKSLHPHSASILAYGWGNRHRTTCPLHTARRQQGWTQTRCSGSEVCALNAGGHDLYILAWNDIHQGCQLKHTAEFAGTDL